MEARERLTAAVRGGRPDRQPTVMRSLSPGHEADAVVVPASAVTEALATHPGQAVLAEILSPFGVALARGIPLNDLLRDEPDQGAVLLAELEAKVREEIEFALGQGADGIFYVLDGAYPSAASPMQYGGHYLEVDRSLLEQITAARLNILYVEGGPETYFDCVTDLPAHALGWNARASGLSVGAMKKVWSGALAASDPAAELFLGQPEER